MLLAARYGGLGAAPVRGREPRRARWRPRPRRPRRRRRPAPAARRADRLRACSSLVALALRIIDLGDRPFHHDESQDAYFSWIFCERGDYHYQPILHGPLRFYLTAAVYTLFGDSDFTARLAPALMGTLIVALPYLLRRQIGRVAAFARRRAFAVGPTYLYFSRFAREDIYFAAITLGLLVAVFRFLDRPAPRPPGDHRRAAGAAVRHQGDDVHHRLRGDDVLPAGGARRAPAARGDWRDGEIVRAVAGRLGAVGLGAGHVRARVRAAVHRLPHQSRRAVGRHLRRAWTTGSASRRRPRRRALVLLPRGPVRRGVADRCCSARVGIVWSSLRHPTMLRAVPDLDVRGVAGRLLVGLGALRLAGDAPAAAAGAAGRRSACRRSGTSARRAACGRAGSSRSSPASPTPATRRSSSTPARRRPARAGWSPRSPREDVKRRRRPRARQRPRATAQHGARYSVTVDSGQGATFPYAWYFRDLPTGYIDMATPNYRPHSQVLIMTAGRARAAAAAARAPTRAGEFQFRVWWVRDWTRSSSRRLVALVHRAQDVEPHRRACRSGSTPRR